MNEKLSPKDILGRVIHKSHPHLLHRDDAKLLVPMWLYRWIKYEQIKLYAENAEDVFLSGIKVEIGYENAIVLYSPKCASDDRFITKIALMPGWSFDTSEGVTKEIFQIHPLN